MARRLDDVRLAVLMLDGIGLKGRTNVVALGISTDGVKIPLGLWEGSTENAALATALLSDLVERGLDVTQGVLVVLDGSKALRRAVRDVLGERCPVQRCVRHRERNVMDHLPERDRDGVRRRLRLAWDDNDHAGPSSASRPSPQSWSAATRAPPPPCARGSPRRSPSPGSASPARSGARSAPRTRSSR